MLLASCGGTPTPDTSSTLTPSVTSSKTDTGSSVIDSSTVYSSTVDSSTADSSTVDAGTVDSSTADSSTVDSSTVDSSTVDSSAVDSSTTDSSKDEPPIEPDEPYFPDKPDQAIDIAVNGVSDYVVVYDDRDILVEEFTTQFLALLSKTHKIELTAIKASVGTDSEHCIYIGNLREAYPVKSKLNSQNDFGAFVSGDDYVLYATNSRLYDYLYEMMATQVLASIRGGSWSTRPAKNFIYHESDYAEISFVDYAIEKHKGLNWNCLLDIFAPCTFVASDGTELVYRIYVPYDYDKSKDYPVFTFMHGAGERGNDNRDNLMHVFSGLLASKESPAWNSIIIAPQCPDGNQWVDTPWAEGGYRVDEVPESNEIKAVFEILDFVKSAFSTDTDRYYVAGLSMGGFAAWDMIMRHPEVFAGAVPICGGGDYKQAHKLVNMPIYTLHDKNDTTVPMSGTKEMVVALETLGSTVIFYEELKGYGHNVWTYASEKAEIWQWLFAQSKSAE